MKFTYGDICFIEGKSGYYFKVEPGAAKKRISRDEFEMALHEFMNEETDDVEQNLFDEEYQARKINEEAERQSREAADRQTEDTFNGKPGKATGETKRGAALQPVEEKPAKKKATKRPKTAWRTNFDGEEVTLTEKQVDFFKHLPDTHFWENGVDSCIWIDCLCDDIGGQFEGKPMTVGAMVSTLCEKGLATRMKQRVNGRKATSFELTGLGKVVARHLGL